VVVGQVAHRRPDARGLIVVGLVMADLVVTCR
jgi:hypothetical protein